MILTFAINPNQIIVHTKITLIIRSILIATFNIIRPDTDL